MRFENWPERLAEEVRAAKSRPFVWGTHDCASFVSRVVEALTGINWKDTFLAYTDAAGAQDILNEQGSLEELVTECLGEPIPALTAQRGDVCLIELPEGLHGEHGPFVLGICDGSRVVVARPPQGIAMLPIKWAVKAWRV
jgi:hypothetical protein